MTKARAELKKELAAIFDNDESRINELKIRLESNIQMLDGDKKILAELDQAVSSGNCGHFTIGAFESQKATVANREEKIAAIKAELAELENPIDDFDTAIEDAIFEQAEIINGHAEQIAECAAAVEGGEMTIEGKVVMIPDKNGKPHYYKYSWDNSRNFAFDTTLLPISKKVAQEIAKEWSLAHGEISFEDFMKASNAEYKKIRKLYLAADGWIVREYDKELAEETEIEEYIVSELSQEIAVNAEIENAKSAAKFAISLPKEDFSETAIENLKAILSSKANLIKTALNIKTVEMKISENDLKFAWFDKNSKVEEIQAYNEFLFKVGELAKKQKRVTAKEKAVPNERYAFRCFLLRIGMIGAEYKNFRKILLKNLSGNCAFKSGNRGGKM